MSSSGLYCQRARVWLPDPERVWRSAELLRPFTPGDPKMFLQLEDGSTVEHTLDPRDLPPLRNPNILEGENDLTTLSYLHEPAVLNNLRVRFVDSKMIYTYCGIVLVAVNPYQNLPIYDADVINAYRDQNLGDLDPHIFAVAEEAFKQMSRARQNQSIVVSGESGAGKTVSAKYAMRYFATVSGSSEDASVEQKVLASSPIMEALGNAKTTRNDNSSRFGKYIEIGFDKKQHITGAHMRTFLLEKSRVVFQAEGERNYHIFYQLCASSRLPEFKSFKLGCAEDFHFTNQGQDVVIKGVDDRREMVNTRTALTLLGVGEKDQMSIYQILAAILHLSNVAVKDQSCDSSLVQPDCPHLRLFCDLSGVSAPDMAHWLCHKKLQTSSETFVKKVSRVHAVNGRDALAKHVYARLFSWIVDAINKSLRSAGERRSFIGVLDIYGFETFEVNSFEQFCINYANEKLQQQFNQHVFKLDQQEYMKEQIPWTLIDFYDNQPCIDLIEASMGVLDLLDEECKMPRGSDDSWAQKLYNNHLKKSLFDKPRLSNRAFIIVHFADKVQYECEGFLEKNKDAVNEEQMNVLKNSRFQFLLKLCEDAEKPSRSSRSRNDTKKTVGLQFRQSLKLLMDALDATAPHYVRCIKPNDRKTPFHLDPVRTVQQLRACGILETIRISAAGFPSRWTYQEFYSRYRVLMTRQDVLADKRQTCKNLLEKLIQDPDKYQLGRSKIFFRAGQVAYLEKLHSDTLRTACVGIQKNIRRWLARRRFLRLRSAAVTIQRHVRGHRARRHVELLRQTQATLVLQRNLRMWASRRRYRRQREAAVVIQCFWRSQTARRRFYEMRFEHKARIIQRWVRGWLVRTRVRRRRDAVVLLQSCARRLLAKRKLKELKVEARSVDHLKKLNVGMENKILQLQHKINEQQKENKELQEQLVAVSRTINTQKQRLDRETEKRIRAEQEARVQAETLPGLLEQLADLQEELDQIRLDRDQLEHQVKVYKERTNKTVEELNMKNNLLHSDNHELNQLIQQQTQQLTEIGSSAGLKLLEKELSEERSNYQNLLSVHLQLEELHRDLKQEMDLDIFADKFSQRKSDSNYSSNSSQLSGSLESSEDEEDHVHKQDDSVDLPVLLKLQRKVSELERDKQMLLQQLERSEEAQLKSDNDSAEQKNAVRAELDLETLKRQELESENRRLKQNLGELRKSLTLEDSSALPPAPGTQTYNTLLEQLNSSTEELEMRKEEVLLLRSHMVRQEALKHKDSLLAEGVNLDLGEGPSFQDVDKSTEIRTLNEDGELWLAYEGLKETNRLLEAQLNKQENIFEDKQKHLREELKKVKEEKQQQEKLLDQTLQLPQDARVEACLKFEITRLARENLELVEKQEKQEKTMRKLKKQLKVNMERIEQYEVTQQSNESSMNTTHRTVHLPRKEKEYQGMLEYKTGDVTRLVKNLVMDLQARGVAISLIPGLPAYIFFMCLRYADSINDDRRVSTLLNSIISGIKGVIKRRADDFEVVSFWLANSCRLLNCLKQYSGDESYMQHNTIQQNQHCISNFELSDYQRLFSDLSVQIYRQLIKCMENILHPLIVAGLLENENIQGVLGSKPSRKRSQAEDAGVTVEVLLTQLSVFYTTLRQHGLDLKLVQQVVRQQFYIICAVALNHLLLRKDLCSWSKGLQIRYSVWQLEEWLMERDLAEGGAKNMLEPLIQAAQLLQIKKKTEADAQAICSMCTHLNTSQIIKVLNLYTPVIEFEERVSTSFINNIQDLLKDRDESSTMMMDTKKIFFVTLPFSPSSVALQSLQIPASLNLDFLSRI